MNKISGPLLDRIDLQVEIEPVAFDAMASREGGEPSEAIRRRVIVARAIQQLRYKGESGVYCNAQMNSRLLHEHAWPDAAGMTKLKERMERLNMSARAFDRILRVSRTIADLASAVDLIERGMENSAEELAKAAAMPVKAAHLAEAIGYRTLDRGSYGQTY